MSFAATIDNPATGRLARLVPPAGPARVLATSTLITSIGFGGYASGSVLFFTRGLGLAPTQVGAGLSLAGSLAIVANPYLGRLADRLGPRKVAVAVGVVQVCALVALLFVGSFAAFLPLICVLGVAESAAFVCRGTLTSALMGPEGRVRVSAYLRSVLNAGFAVGSLVAGVAVWADTRAAYSVLMIVVAVLMTVGYGCYFLLPRVAPSPAVSAERKRREGLRNYPYVLCGIVCGTIAVGDSILIVGLPVWVVEHTTAPKPLAVACIGLNTLLVVALQVRASKRADTVEGARRLLLYAGAALTAACVTFSLTHNLPTAGAVILLVAGTVVLTMGELWNSAATWGLAFNLAPIDSQGTHLGAFSIGTTLRTVIGPIVVIALITTFGAAGWLALAAVFVVAMAAASPIVGWAIRFQNSGASTADTGRDQQ